MTNFNHMIIGENFAWFLGGGVLFLSLYVGVKLVASGLRERSKQK